MPQIRNIALSLLQSHLTYHPKKAALLFEERVLTYEQLWEYSLRFAAFLDARGIPARCRIAIVLPDCFSFYYVFFGCLLSGVIPVMISPHLSRDAYEEMLLNAEVRLLVTTPDSPAGTIEQEHFRPILVDADALLEKALLAYPPDILPFEPDDSDIAFMLYTAGTTGKPKGVPHRHGDIFFIIEAAGEKILNLSNDDIVYSAQKLFSAYGFGNSLVFPLNAGATTLLSSEQSSPKQLLEIFKRYRPTVFCGVPSMFDLLIENADETIAFNSLRCCISSTAVLPARIFTAWKSLTGVEILDGICSTEMLHMYIANRPGAAVPGSCGQVIPPFEARLINSDGRDVKPGSLGELLIRGTSASPYYWKQPAKSDAAMLPNGWFKTGDLFIQRENYFFYQGRAECSIG
jgi:benzoate-CoA ligase